jgi:hypothetical protein
MARLTFMQGGKPVQIQLPEKILWVWAGVMAVLVVTVLILSLLLIFQVQKKSNLNQFVELQGSSLNNCEGELKTFTDASLTTVITPDTVASLDAQMFVEASPEVIKAIVENPEPPKIIKEVQSPKVVEKSIPQIPNIEKRREVVVKIESKTIIDPVIESVPVTFSNFKTTEIVLPKIKFKNIKLDVLQDHAQLSFHVYKNTKVVKNGNAIQGTIVLACETEQGLKVIPDRFKASIQEGHLKQLAGRGHTYKIKRAKPFSIDISPCKTEPGVKDIWMVAVSNEGEIVGKENTTF